MWDLAGGQNIGSRQSEDVRVRDDISALSDVYITVHNPIGTELF